MQSLIKISLEHVERREIEHNTCSHAHIVNVHIYTYIPAGSEHVGTIVGSHATI